jgi:hypothetical protein
VRVADSIDAFIVEVRSALTPDVERIEAGVACARGSSWESIVASMDRLVATAVRARTPWSAPSETTQGRHATTTARVGAGTATGTGPSAQTRSSSHGEAASTRA